jgi:hypothetical protein
VGKVAFTTTTSYITWDGRVLDLTEVGLTATPIAPLSLGVAYRDSNGHGQSEQSTYNGHGWEGWASLRLLSERKLYPELALNGQTFIDDIALQKVTSTESEFAAPRARSTGIDLCASRHIGADVWQLDAGTYDGYLFGEREVTVMGLGARYAHPFTRILQGHLALAGYRDNFEGGRYHSYVLQAGGRAGHPDRVHLLLAGNYFPRGVPLAGTPLSTAALVGAIYGGTAATSAINTSAFGYLSAQVEIPF